MSSEKTIITELVLPEILHSTIEKNSPIKEETVSETEKKLPIEKMSEKISGKMSGKMPEKIVEPICGQCKGETIDISSIDLDLRFFSPDNRKECQINGCSEFMLTKRSLLCLRHGLQFKTNYAHRRNDLCENWEYIHCELFVPFYCNCLQIETKDCECAFKQRSVARCRNCYRQPLYKKKE